MAYIVLALGAILSIGGALSIYHGAGIVEVERGWTGVIAGATALTGGVVTIALGLILKTLLDLRPMLASRAAVPELPVDIAVAHDFDARTADEPSLAPPVGEPTSLMTAELESDMLAAILAQPEPAIEAERPFGAPAERPKVRSLPVADIFEHSRSLPTGDLAPLEQASEPDPVESPGPHPEPVAEKSRFKINFKRQPAPPLPEPKPVEEPEGPAMDDWLDRAFSALDNEPPPGPSGAPPHPHEAALVPAEDTLVHAEPASAVAVAEPDPQHAFHVPEPARHEPPPPPAATSTVIGRYEADGTSYVMYADGSIEAQSEAGVYRFNSMTELKAFIESTA
ncbi:hypothetical protein [Beijerinckia sp. L45]|uniref:hypothetical protein n=1 Tax=Beijerinckia sp. L45 TaxID=1641855 RepID=UPI00131C33FA|nr:hypothetical protein [Beijerinckia sp. L45]